LQRAANRSNNGNSQAWKALDRAQTQATNALNKTEAGRTYQQAVHNLRSASGAPVVLLGIRLTHAFSGVRVKAIKG
jgi:hypothetical protein